MKAMIIPFAEYQWMLYFWMVLAVLIFFVLLKITAPYGRHTTSQWGPTISNRIGWTVMELPVLLMLAVLLIPLQQNLSLASWIMVGLFCFHYVNRCFIFPFRLHTKGKKMPLLIVCSGIFFNLANGFALGYYFGHYAHYEAPWLRGGRFIVGLVLFLTGMYINWKADNILIHLRKPNETQYKIPTKWLFEYISCPNLFGELLEWLGFAILCWNLPALCFFIWTAANLIPRALSHHRWYHQQFGNYPKDRYAIIPFLF